MGLPALRGAEASLPHGATYLRRTADYCIVVHRNVMVQCVRGAIDHDFLRASLEGHHAALVADRRGYGVITMVAPSAKLPPSDVRDEATKLRVKTQHHLLVQSVYIGGEGFFASTMRAVITGIVTLARSRVPLRMANDAIDAGRFVAERLGLADAELVDVVRAIWAADGADARR